MTKKKKTRRLVGDLPDMVPGVSLGITMRNLLPEEYEEKKKDDTPYEWAVIHDGFRIPFDPYSDPPNELYNPMVMGRIDSSRTFIKPVDVKLSPEMELFLKRLKEIQEEFIHALSSTEHYKNGE